jgi:hypothetical protein
LIENETAKGGVPSCLRGVVLLRRQPGDDGRFLGTVNVETEVSGVGVGLRESWWRMAGKIPRDEPLVFDPRAADRPGDFERYRKRLADVDLDSLAAVVSDEEAEKTMGR